MEKIGGFLSIRIGQERNGRIRGNVFLLKSSRNILDGLRSTQRNVEMIVYSYYVLDIVHKGHLLYMQTAKSIAGKNGLSIVDILTDELD